MYLNKVRILRAELQEYTVLKIDIEKVYIHRSQIKSFPKPCIRNFCIKTSKVPENSRGSRLKLIFSLAAVDPAIFVTLHTADISARISRCVLRLRRSTYVRLYQRRLKFKLTEFKSFCEESLNSNQGLIDI